MRMLKPMVLVVVVGLGLTMCDQALCQWEKKDEGRGHRGAFGRERGQGRFRRGEEERVGPAEAEEKYLEFLKENFRSEFKEMKADLEQLKEDNPDAYQRKIQRGYRHMRRLQKMKEKDPERFEIHIEMMGLGMKCRKLSKEYRNAETSEEKEEIKAELTENLGELFDIRLAQGEVKVKELEEELLKLKERSAERKKNKDEIVARRLEELTGSADGLKW